MGRRPKPVDPEAGPIGDAIRAACTWKGWTQADLARAMGVLPQHVSNVCHGRLRPSVEWLDRCARVLGVNRGEFGLPASPETTERPTAVLELVLMVDELGMPDLLRPDNDPSVELLRSLGFRHTIPVDGAGLSTLVRRAADWKIAIMIRTDLDAFPS